LPTCLLVFGRLLCFLWMNRLDRRLMFIAWGCGDSSPTGKSDEASTAPMKKKHLNTTASSQREAYDINVWTQMTFVLVGKGLVLGDWPSRLEVIGVPGTYYNSIAFNHIFVLASRELSRWEAYTSPFSFTASHQQTLATSTAVKAASITPIVKFLPHHFLPLVRSPTTASNVASLWLRIRRVI